MPLFSVFARCFSPFFTIFTVYSTSIYDDWMAEGLGFDDGDDLVVWDHVLLVRHGQGFICSSGRLDYERSIVVWDEIHTTLPKIIIHPFFFFFFFFKDLDTRDKRKNHVHDSVEYTRTTGEERIFLNKSTCLGSTSFTPVFWIPLPSTPHRMSKDRF